MGGVFVQPVAVIRDDTDAMKTNRIRVVVSEGRNREVRGSEHGGCCQGHCEPRCTRSK